MPIIRRGSRVVFYATPPIIAVTLVAVVWLTYQSIVTVLAYPTPDDVR